MSGQIPANRSYIHRTFGARIIDPKAIDQKRGCGLGLAMAEFDLTAPPSDLHDDRPNLAARALALLRDDKIKDAREGRLFHLAQTDMLQSGRVDVLRSAVERRNADKVGRALDQADKTMLLRIHLPSLRRDGGFICRNLEQKQLRFGRKVRTARAGDDDVVGAEADRGARQTQHALPVWVGDR